MTGARVVGFAGRARAGKDTAAGMLSARLSELDVPHQLRAFAKPMREMLACLGIEEPDDKEAVMSEFGVSFRWAMQTLGTEWGRRHLGPDVWINQMERFRQRMSSDSILVVTDVRFADEAEWIRQHGLVVHLDAANVIGSSHISEAGIKGQQEDWYYDNTCRGSGSLDALREGMRLLSLEVVDGDW